MTSDKTTIYAVRRHARKRCKERMGFSLTKKLRLQIISMIEKDEHIFIETCKRDRFVADVDLSGIIIRVVYSTTLEDIITVLDRKPIEILMMDV